MSPEPIRLVIWDLDDTFWHGTLSEEGIRDYVRAHHNVVIELAHRGILSSICSKNDFAAVRDLLEREGLWGYFVFPSIDWTPKGPRIARLVEQMQLRPETVLFLDDNASNLAEARAQVPGLQTGDPSLIANLLIDPLCRGGHDPDLTRLAQYKVLEQRADDAARSTGNVEDFLRSSNIQVTIDSDIEANLDRAIELINRTNQLNFTKRRLPADPEQAREQLRGEISVFHARAGLVSVRDRYGDYGICGFYLATGVLRRAQLDHFCFSCRVLGMGVERWLYDQIGRPDLTVAGDVLTDLSAVPAIDWINTAPASTDAASTSLDIPEVVLRGGCELDSIAHYFQLQSSRVLSETNRLEWLVFLKYNTSTNLLLTRRSLDAEAIGELRVLGFGPDDLASGLWQVRPGGIGIFCGWSDAYATRYRHRRLGFEVAFDLDRRNRSLCDFSDEDFADYAAELGLTAEGQGHVRQFVDHVRLHYDALPSALAEDELRANMRAICAGFPADATLFLLLVHERGVGGEPRRFYDRADGPPYNAVLRETAREFANVEVVDIGKFVTSEDDCQLIVDHFDRRIYHDLYREMLALYRGRRNAAVHK